MRTVLREEIMDLLTGGDVYPFNNFSMPQLRSYVEQFMNGDNDLTWGIWHFYALQKWHQIHLQIHSVNEYGYNRTVIL
jgi:hypothetical protein